LDPCITCGSCVHVPVCVWVALCPACGMGKLCSCSDYLDMLLLHMLWWLLYSVQHTLCLLSYVLLANTLLGRATAWWSLVTSGWRGGCGHSTPVLSFMQFLQSGGYGQGCRGLPCQYGPWAQCWVTCGMTSRCAVTQQTGASLREALPVKVTVLTHRRPPCSSWQQ
jgi:hypothetical protein